MAALSGLAGARVELERPGSADHGDYATNAALRLAPAQGRPPRELAQELADKAVALPEVERAEVAGPGFVNLWLDRAWYGDEPYRMVQLVWPDRTGWLPWEPGFDPALSGVQLLLGDVPDGL